MKFLIDEDSWIPLALDNTPGPPFSFDFTGSGIFLFIYKVLELGIEGTADGRALQFTGSSAGSPPAMLVFSEASRSSRDFGGFFIFDNSAEDLGVILYGGDPDFSILIEYQIVPVYTPAPSPSGGSTFSSNGPMIVLSKDDVLRFAEFYFPSGVYGVEPWFQEWNQSELQGLTVISNPQNKYAYFGDLCVNLEGDEIGDFMAYLVNPFDESKGPAWWVKDYSANQRSLYKSNVFWNRLNSTIQIRSVNFVGYRVQILP